MPRIAGVNIPDNKKIDVSLTYIFGVGLPMSKKILTQVNINPNVRAKDLSADEVNKLKEFIEKNYKIEGELKREIMMNIKRLKDITSWRGMRHAKGLTVRGQKTRKNTRTIRGNVRKTVGSGRKPAATPT